MGTVMTLGLVDTHCHLTAKDLQAQHERVVADAVGAGVARMITVVCEPEEMDGARRIRRAHPCVYIAAGIHPHEAQKHTREEIERFASVWTSRRDEGPGVVAAGEMGLDYHYDFSPRDVQRDVFRLQLELAAESGRPIVVHSREAHEDTIRILCEEGYDHKPVVFHCFSGTADEAAEIRAHGWRTSFTGIITFKGADGPRQACAQTPAEHLMFESDAPYLSPEPVRHMRPNEPQNLIHTARFAAGLRGQSFESLAAATTANAAAFYGLDRG